MFQNLPKCTSLGAWLEERKSTTWEYFWRNLLPFFKYSVRYVLLVGIFLFTYLKHNLLHNAEVSLEAPATK